MRPVDWRELRKFAESHGCVHDRTKGDHYIMTKPGMARPVVIPMKRDLSENISLGIARTLGIARSELERFLREGR